jgi:nucleotide-binding universal stress UspA family protein
MEIKKILWPTDFSENSAEAIPYITTLSEKYGAEIHMLYVVEDVHQFDHIYGDANPEFLDEFQKKVIETGKELQDNICKTKFNYCPGYQKHIIVGDPAREIVKLAETENIDIVVMTTHGHGTSPETRGYHIGNVSDKVVKNSAVPVLTINPFQKNK